MFKFLKPYRTATILGLAAKFIETILELFLPLLMAKLIKQNFSNFDISYTIKVSLLVLAIILVNIVLAMLGQFFAAKASTSFGNDLRRSTFKHINSLTFSNIDKIGAGSLITRLTNDIASVQQIIFMTIRIGLRAPFIAIGAITMTMILAPDISLVLISIVLILSLIIVLIVKLNAPVFRDVRKKLDRIAIITSENISGARVVRAYSRQSTEIERLTKSAAEYKTATLRATRLSILMHPISTLLVQLGIFTIIVIGAYNYDRTQVANLTAFVTYLTQILLAITIISNLANVFVRGFTGVLRINEVLKLPLTENPKGGICELSEIDLKSPPIEFKEVSAGYGNSCANILNNISFKLESGQKLGIIGGTGSGKSSLISLIPAFYQARSGQVLVFGRNVLEFYPVFLRKLISVVFQKASLISGTVRDNIAFGRDISDQEILKALKTSQSDFVLSSNDCLDKIIERDGLNLSGGQKQRLAIARALAGDPKILILDDSASALDYATNRALNDSIITNYPSTIQIIVSQRAFAIRETDTILVLDNGNIVGLGCHDDLVLNNPTYKAIYMSQIPNSGVK
ncbi:MAG: ABC transporter ATP-binding protein/permease [Christensenellaceae bacterium]|nr:ABC transporter ATP-binding protein/permease [Christensenellaceae bacterium]